MTEESDRKSQPRDEDSQRFTTQTSIRDVLDAFEKHGEKNIPTGELADELGYSKHGITHRLREIPEYVEETDLGEGNPNLWSLKHTRDDFIGAFERFGNITHTDKIVEHVGCPEEVAHEWLLKLEDEGEIGSLSRSEHGIVWGRKS